MPTTATRAAGALLLALLTFITSCAQEQPADSILIPETFIGTQENKIENPSALAPIIQKLQEGKSQVRILHIGDSHIRGHYLPGYARRTLAQELGGQAMLDDPIGYNKTAIATETGKPGLVYSAIGINGATTRHFLKPEQLKKIADQHPDLIIISFGTNEGYAGNYSSDKHTENIHQLISALREATNDTITFLFTTPPGCYKRNPSRQFLPNKYNGEVAATIHNYALDNNHPLWDLYNIAGGDANACTNWTRANLMQPDHIHFTTTGYQLQGTLLGQALIAAIMAN